MKYETKKKNPPQAFQIPCSSSPVSDSEIALQSQKSVNTIAVSRWRALCAF